MLLQRGEIRKVRDVRQADDGNVDCLFRRRLPQPRRETVLVVNVRVGIRYDAEHRHAGERLELPESRLEQGCIAAEFVDDRADDAFALGRLQQGNRAVKLGKDAAAVNVAHKDHRRVHKLGQPHIHYVVRAEVDLRRRARALDDDDVVFRSEAVVGRKDIGNERALHAKIVARGIVPAHLAVYDELAAHIARGLEQDRVHAHITCQSRGLRLRGLRAAHLQPVGGHIAVERHVLALERSDAPAVLQEDAAERRDEQTLARAGHRALHHDALRHPYASPSAFNSMSFSSLFRIAVRYQPGHSPGKSRQSRSRIPFVRSFCARSVSSL